MKFYLCEHCKNIVTFLHNSGVPVVCCGENMKEITVNTVEASYEKHIPMVVTNGNVVEVNVGSVDHPMVPEHYIMFVVAETSEGFIKKTLQPNDKPHCTFILNANEKLLGVYEYCNLHGLWKA